MTRSRRTPTAVLAAVLAALLLVLAGCSARGDARGDGASNGDEGDDGGHAHSGDASRPGGPTPLREGERLIDVAMPRAYTPRAPYGVGTDDYRCFVLDPGLTEDAFLTGIDVKPGNAKVVHHVILFQLPEESSHEAATADRRDPGPGWTCFGGTGLGGSADQLNDAPWIGAWAPGGGEQVHADDVGIPLERGARIVMQVHYNLLAGDAPDVSSARLRLAPGDAGLAPLRTLLLLAPVELPCRPGEGGRLCARDAALADVKQRFGPAGRIAEYLYRFCGDAEPQAGPEQSCTRRATRPMTIRAAAGHMHLLGRQISIAVNGETVLDIDEWNFDDQGADPVDPVEVGVGDELTVTCRHDQALRDINPALKGQPERYVVWGEGTTDEMCLGILMATPS